MPRLLALAPRQKFPPPTTTAISESRLVGQPDLPGQVLGIRRNVAVASRLPEGFPAELQEPPLEPSPFHCGTHLERTKAELYFRRCKTLFTPTEPLGAERPVGRERRTYEPFAALNRLLM